MLRVTSMSKRFGGLAAVEDVSFEVSSGERVGLLGPNGAGKTTLTNLVCGDLRPTSGSVHLAGEDISSLPPHRRFRLGLARTYQIANPFPVLTARDATALGALAHTRRTSDALEVADAELVALGLGAKRGTPMSELTIVEKKLVELARVLAGGAKVLVLDELLAGLRPDEIDPLIDVMRATVSERSMAIVMIEHIMGAVMKFCDRLIVMKEGVVIADGAIAKVMADPAVVDAYLGRRRGSVA